MIEERPIPGYEGEYVATSAGDVYSLKRGQRRKLKRSYASGDGWARVSLQPESHANRGDSRAFTTASIILLTFVGPRPGPGYVASHKNEDPSDDSITNLEWRRHTDLQAERVTKALQSASVDAVVAGMTDIIRAIQRQEPIKNIAKANGISRNLVETLRSCLLGITLKRGRAAKYRRTLPSRPSEPAKTTSTTEQGVAA
jgi:hypothetical protein